MENSIKNKDHSVVITKSNIKSSFYEELNLSLQLIENISKEINNYNKIDNSNTKLNNKENDFSIYLSSLKLNLTFLNEVLSLFYLQNIKAYKLSIIFICVYVLKELKRIRNSICTNKEYYFLSIEEESRLLLNIFRLSRVYPLANSKMGYLFLRYLKYYLTKISNSFERNKNNNDEFNKTNELSNDIEFYVYFY